MSDNIILRRFPQCYLDKKDMQQIADALTRGASDVLQEWNDELVNYERDRLDPKTCLPEWLDWLAYWAGWGVGFWDTQWSDDIKRKLLINTNFIWKNRGNRECIALIFSIFNLDASLEPLGGFILSVTTIPGFIGTDSFSYVIRVNKDYVEKTKERELIKQLVLWFLPCWVEIPIVSRT